MDEQDVAREQIVAALTGVREAFNLSADESGNLMRVQILCDAARAAQAVKEEYHAGLAGRTYDGAAGLSALAQAQVAVSAGSGELERAIGHLARGLQWLIPEPGLANDIVAKCRASINATLLIDELHNKVESWLQAMTVDLYHDDMM